MVRQELAEKAFRKEARECGFVEGAWLCYEEDCDGSVALRELMDKKMYQALVNQYFRPGEYEAVINRSLQTYHPEYWQARAKDLKEKGQPSIQRKKKERER